MSMPRRPLQRALLVVLSVLLLTLGARALRASASGSHGHHVERVSERHVEVNVVTVSARDVLFDESFTVQAGDVLGVDLSSENVTVRTVSGTRARIVVEGRGRDAAAEFARRRFSAYTTADSLVARTNPPRRSGWRSSRTDAHFQVTIDIPRRFSADIDVGSGNVEVASLDGDLTVDVGSGNVDVSDVMGRRVSLDTGSGNIRARALRGDVRLDTGSGNIDVDRIDGSLLADTGSGRVRVGSVSGGAEVDTSSGSVELTLLSAAASSVSTGSGSITVHVPRSAGFDLDADGSSVRIDEALRFSGQKERDEARGRIGQGGPDLRLNAGSGSVRLIAD